MRLGGASSSATTCRDRDPNTRRLPAPLPPLLLPLLLLSSISPHRHPNPLLLCLLHRWHGGAHEAGHTRSCPTVAVFPTPHRKCPLFAVEAWPLLYRRGQGRAAPGTMCLRLAGGERLGSIHRPRQKRARGNGGNSAPAKRATTEPGDVARAEDAGHDGEAQPDGGRLHRLTLTLCRIISQTLGAL